MLFAALKDNLLNYYKRRIILGFVFFTLFSVILFIRLFILQVIEYEDLATVADSNRTAKRDVIADRGFIYDRNMNILVSNTPTYDLVLNKDYLKKGGNVNELLMRVSEVIDFDMNAVQKELADKNVKSVLISRGLTLSDIAYFEEYADDFIGLSVEFHSVRKYTDGLAYSHILGYVREVTPEMMKRNKGIYKQGSIAGIMGVELQYEDELRGINGVRYIERDARGRTVQVLSEEPAIAGNDIILTVDSELQKHIVELMKDKKGAAVVLDISDNSVMSLYSAPSYDLNMFTPYLDEKEWKLIHQDKRSPLVNRPIEGLYSPGSVYKVAMALAGLEENAVDRNTSFNCSGTFYLNSTFSYRCWKRTGHGKVNLRRALAESCDVYFYNLGLQLDIDKMEYYSKILSLGEWTGIDLPNEKKGVYPSRSWKMQEKKELWYPGDTVNTSIGQGYMTATPLQIGVMMSGVFNGGKIYKPRVIKAISDQTSDTVKNMESELKHQIYVPGSVRKAIMSGLIDAVYKQGGTSTRAKISNMLIGGKTGTAQVVSAKITDRYKNGEIPEEYRDHAWFTGVFPAREPQYVVVILVENGGGGGASAAPIGGAVIKKMLEMGYVSED